MSKGFHLASTWLTGLGATISAWWILVANAWMQHPVGMAFNPDTMRNEMVDFLAVAFSPVAVMKFLHTVLSSWVLGAVFVIGISAWYLLRKRETEFAVASIKVASYIGLFAALVTAGTGDKSAYQVAHVQPMKLAAMEGLYDGGYREPLTVVGSLKIPYMLSFLATHDTNGYVPGINDLLNGGYEQADGTVAISAEEKIARGNWLLRHWDNTDRPSRRAMRLQQVFRVVLWKRTCLISAMDTSRIRLLWYRMWG